MKKFFRYFHMYISIFFLPLALMYAFTGMVSLLEYEGDITLTTDMIPVSQQPNIAELKDIAKKYLSEKNLFFSNGFRSVHNNEGIVTGTLLDGMGFFANNPRAVAVFHVVRRGFIAYTLALHVGQGKWYFNVLAIAFSVALALFYLSGLLIIKFSKYKTSLFITFAIGTLIISITGYISGH